MKSPKAIVGVAIIFIIGVMIGSVGTYTLMMLKLRDIFKSPDHFSQFMGQRISRKLRLDPDQKEQLLEVVEKTHARIKEIRQEITPRLETVFREAEDDIKSFLRPDQKERLEEMIQRKETFLARGHSTAATPGRHEGRRP
jgi:biopolymer transport protein ExbB/TolQ